MKKSLFLGAFLLLGTISWSQVAEFEFAPHDSISIELAAPAMLTEAVADLEIHSLQTSDITVKWQRNVLMLTQGCGTKVCDLNACYPESFSTKTFVLGAGVTGPISLHFVNPAGMFCQSVVRLDMWNVDFPDVVVAGWFIYNFGSSSVDGGEVIPSAKIFPNPTADYFSIEHVEGMKMVRLFDLTGREVASYNGESTQTFRLDNQTAGQYVVMVQNEAGNTIAVAQLDIK